ncbi:unnamed protein product [Cuscuta campestris]|uniref:Protein kinase domain-containing protein n=1 Tax=Cuscuta campestris TaxID=132261 RepID=A0A484NFU7_9ASTE|nr:unnamed protein product [Cuscuta campestris]
MLLSGLIISLTFGFHVDQSNSIAISCGSSANLIALNGRLWVGDNSFSLTGQSWTSRAQHKASFLIDPVPYQTARASRREFSYMFPVKPGQKFIRLHFNPAPYKGFKKPTALFTVRIGPYTLLRSFSPSLAADSLGVKILHKEFCVNVKESEDLLTITFTPSSQEEDVYYAFVNGIEIVSMPTGLYFTQEGDLGSHVVGQKHRFYIDNSTTLEMVRRLNVGGHSISSTEDGSMFRDWEDDNSYLLIGGGGAGASIETAMKIKYPEIMQQKARVAPLSIYQTARTAGVLPGKQQKMNVIHNRLTWIIPVDLGFRYLVRLHFCEFDPEILARGERQFRILINNEIAEDNADVVKWSGVHGIAVYRDYVATVGGDRVKERENLLITLQPTSNELCCKRRDGILNGLEIFKLSNPDNSLAGAAQRSVSKKIPERQEEVSFDRKNAIATAFTVALVFLNIAIYHLRRLSQENSTMRNREPSSVDQTFRQFSLEEIRLTTNNFSPKFVIGAGGYGNVYKGCMDGGKMVVAIKRLKEGSKQGDNEFWTEIKLLSKARNEHLVSLIGFCNEEKEMMLVYEYMPRGTLEDHLHKFSNHPLSWERRLKILIGAARGLHYLHASYHKVIHRDVKSSNILIDENWVAKISDFGLSKMGPGNESFTHVSTNVKGTFGYFDPEYFLTRRLTTKSDVYSFGTVLLEVLTGRPALDKRLLEEQKSLVTWAVDFIRKGEVDEIVDPGLAGQVSRTCLNEFVIIARRCLHRHPRKRPDMDHVVTSLELVLVLQQEEEEDGVIDTGVHSSDGSISFNNRSEPLPRNNSNSAGQSLFSMITSEDTSVNGEMPASNLKVYTYAALKAATRSFTLDMELGVGEFGRVYKGWVDEKTLMPYKIGSGTIVVIRKLDEEIIQGLEEWQLDVNFLGRLSHPNLVKLIGYCWEEKELLLVYEFMPKGSLENHLFKRDSTVDPLSWDLRLKIAIGAARGLAFLHASEKQIIYRDFKASKILLDVDYNAKISYLGLAKPGPSGDDTHVTTRVLGTYGYAAPEYVATGHLYVKSDVYGFGVVLLEMLTGLRVLDSRRRGTQTNLVEWKRPFLGKKKKLKWIMDPIMEGQYSTEAALQAARLTLRCIELEPRNRPTMEEVVAILEKIECIKKSKELFSSRWANLWAS